MTTLNATPLRLTDRNSTIRMAPNHAGFERRRTPKPALIRFLHDGQGLPLFMNLERSKEKHMCDGWNDMKPRDGVLATAFKNFVKAKGGAMAGK